ncbi:MAG: hypothetical protein IJ720_03130 [Clostridia bacterium]|nr:hypothetical protein [Clostridia bacterium]MBQ8470070.1 hypothetical protein [Clostridia bacterium]MBR1704339.1 hypothetical protein [Clostridia bacterium]
MNETRNDEIEIDLGKVVEAVKKFWALLLTMTLVFGLLGFLASSFGMTKKYVASVDMIVNTSSNADLVSNDQVNSAKNLVSTYSYIITGSSVLTKVIDNLRLDVTYEELAKVISVNGVTDTQVFTVSATTSDLERSKDIVREIIKIAPGEIEKAVEAGSCRVVSDLDYLNDPVSPDVAKYTAVAAFAGFLLSLAYALFRVLSKNFLVTEKDISEQLDLPVLGVIPLLEKP